MARIRGILFDLDETLHSRELAFWRWIEREAHSRPLDRRKVAELDAGGRGPKALLVNFLAEQLQWPEAALEARLTRFRLRVAQEVCAPDYLQTLLNGLAPRFKLGIISNGSGEAQRSKLKTLNIEHYFDPILISEEVGYRKPQAEIFWMAAARWQIPNDQILVVGDDEQADIQGAIGAGMIALRVGDCACATSPCISNLGELEGWLASFGAFV